MMSQFFVRVELNGAVGEDVYASLRAVMEKNGFAPVVNGFDANGQPGTMRLPQTLYFGEQISDVSRLRDSLFAQVEELWGEPAVLVIESAHWASKA